MSANVFVVVFSLKNWPAAAKAGTHHTNLAHMHGGDNFPNQKDWLFCNLPMSHLSTSESMGQNRPESSHWRITF